ncbi:DUF397 domain-containing protein [Spirillospora sp. NPDC052269]
MALVQLEWRRSSHSGTNGGECVEVGAPPVMWRKSRHSAPNGGECVEVASVPGQVALRDSKCPDAGALTLEPASFRSLVASVKQLG